MYIILAIPVFFILIGIELGVSLFQRRMVYRLNDSINDLSMGMISMVGGAFFRTIEFMGYWYVWETWRLFELGTSDPFNPVGLTAGVWVGCFLAKDFMYYWAHRMSHEMNLGWATHIAHHQSEEYNLSVALRQGVFQGLFFWPFYIPLAFIGFPPGVYFVCSQFNTLYQFWIHTRIIGRLGPLEWVFNTPSHHRVHHGSDVKYIDRNHGGTLIVWDRLFGTFQQEEEEPNYGIVTPLKSWNPAWAQVHYFVKLFRQAWAAPRWQDKLTLWFRAPAFQPRGLETNAVPETRRENYRKYNAAPPLGLKIYALLHFIFVLLLVTGWLDGERAMGWAQWCTSAALIIFCLMSIGAIFDLKPWARWVEPLRLVLMSGAMLTYGGGFFGFPDLNGGAFNMVLCAAVLASLIWFGRYHAKLSPAREGLDEGAGAAHAEA
ncbi:MAG: sterol desaturase family protein [Candidatus Hydrogenedentes bacterium]|nr:sterol desaturase family protein [Candidatus Hydrogenedentota bacterium]